MCVPVLEGCRGSWGLPMAGGTDSLIFLRLFFICTFFKAFIEFVTILFLFYVFFFLAVKHVGS